MFVAFSSALLVFCVFSGAVAAQSASMTPAPTAGTPAPAAGTPAPSAGSPPAGMPLSTQWYCKTGFGCSFCWGSTCPSGQTTYASRDACESSSECQAASAPKWYCAPCQTDQSQNCCWICREYGCPANIGATFTNLMDCASSSGCRASYAAYLGAPSSRK